MEDMQIVELYFARDERALGATREKYEPFLLTLAGRFLSDRDGEECVADTYLRAWEAIPPARPVSLRAFLARITRNLAIDRLRRDSAARRGGGEVDAVIDELEAVAPDCALEHVTAEELGSYVNRFIRSLPERDGDIMVRRCFFAQPVGEIARLYSMRPNAVSASLARSRRRLAEYLRKEGLYE